MNKPDIIVVQPTHVDFPLFRKTIRDNRGYFNKVIIVFSKHTEYTDLSNFMKQAMAEDHIHFIDAIAPIGDWRHHAIHRALLHTASNNILFLEQDFIINYADHFLLATISEAKRTIIGFKDGEGNPNERLHPAFLLVPRDLITDESNFAAKPPDYDHFGHFTQHLLEEYNDLYRPLSTLVNAINWEHLQGLTHNYDLVMRGQEPVFEVERFHRYNKELLNLDIEMNDHFKQIIIESS